MVLIVVIKVGKMVVLVVDVMIADSECKKIVDCNRLIRIVPQQKSKNAENGRNWQFFYCVKNRRKKRLKTNVAEKFDPEKFYSIDVRKTENIL
jgi:hypothetical protein